MTGLLRSAAFVAALGGFTSPASATIIEWTYNAFYEDLSSASGRFRYNSASAKFVLIDIEYSGGVTYPAATFDTATGTADEFGGIFVDSANGPDFAGSVSLFFDTITSLGNASAVGGNISNTDVSTFSSSDCFVQTMPFVSGTAFSLTGEVIAPVPIPIALPLLGTALATLGGLAVARRGQMEARVA